GDLGRARRLAVALGVVLGGAGQIALGERLIAHAVRLVLVLLGLGVALEGVVRVTLRPQCGLLELAALLLGGPPLLLGVAPHGLGVLALPLGLVGGRLRGLGVAVRLVGSAALLAGIGARRRGDRPQLGLLPGPARQLRPHEHAADREQEDR